MKKLTVEEMYRICNKYQFFTHGSNYQYDKPEQSYKEIYNTLVNELN